jgi:hypothetical protein
VHTFIGQQNGLNKEAAPDITNDATPGEYFMLFFRNVLPILLETNRYMEQAFTAENKTLPPSQEILMKYMFAFFALVIQMDHDHKPSLKSYWTKDELYHIPFYSNVMSRDRFLTVLNIYILQTMKRRLLKTGMILNMTDYGKFARYLTC